MGTDIHLYVERRKKNGTWERVKPTAWKCSWCDSPNEKCFNCEGKGLTQKEYDRRNYDLFAMLANVRNGTGFAGVKTGNGFEPLDEPRGIPEDLSFPPEPDYSKENDDDDDPWLGDHSFSWCTLAEALAYNYDRESKHEGVVDSAEYAAWVERGRKGRPGSYCGGVSGPKVVHLSNEEMQKLIMSNPALTKKPTGDERWGRPLDEDGKSYFTSVEWTETYRFSAGEAWFNFLEACKPLAKDPKDVRLVFGFDS